MARERTELTLLLSALCAAVLLAGFFFLAAKVVEGSTRAFDVRILEALRHPDHPEVPIGPRWLTSAALDITALGSSTVLGLVTLSISGFLLLQGMKRTAAFVFLATVSGWILNDGLKLVFQRARPEVVPHLRDTMSASFPSGHAMTAAVVYLTLGALTMRLADRRVTKFYCIAVAMILTLLVGASRVFLGVHYPTDVLAGWLLGLLWALVCWTTERRLEKKSGMRREHRELQAP